MKVYILVAVLLRVLIALATSTFFQPDEYFQSLEVAHRIVFGYGFLTWEWTSENPIRSIFYPALNVPIYWLLKKLNLDDTVLLIYGPRVLHGLFASLTDIFVLLLARKTIGTRYTSTAFFLSITSLFHALSLSRSISNSLETSLTTIALSYFPWDTSHPSWRKGLFVSLTTAAVACMVRPTNSVIWVYAILVFLWQNRTSLRTATYAVISTLLIGMTSLLLLFGLDSLYYGKPTLTPLNFLYANLSVSTFYGSSPWHYYLTQAIPILCTTALPFVLHGAWLVASPVGTSASKKMLGLIIWTISIYSFGGHKEWRFIHPLLPALHVLAAKSLVDLYHSYASDRKHAERRTGLPIRKRHISLLLLNVPFIYYLLFRHGRAQVEVMMYLKSLDPATVRSVGFLMPCHSTPWQAYLHRWHLVEPGRIWGLGCEPPLMGENLLDYKDQTDVFYESPAAYFRRRFPPTVDTSYPPSPFPYSIPGKPHIQDARAWHHQWPQYLVIFKALLKERGVFEGLTDRGYRTVWEMERGWEGDARRRGGVIVMKHSS